ALPKGEMMHRGERVDPGAVRNVALFTVEGENDDISGVGQTEAAQDICTGIPADRCAHYLQPKVGHYGVFNGSLFRAEIAPRIRDFLRTFDQPVRSDAKSSGHGPAPSRPVSAPSTARKPAAASARVVRKRGRAKVA